MGARPADLERAATELSDRIAASLRGHSQPHSAPSWPEVLATTGRLWLQRQGMRRGRLRRGQENPARRPGRPARGLVATASALLPRADRARYAEEYLAELWDLATAGAGRLALLRYAFRQLLRAVPVRSAALAPRRKGAAP